MPADLEAVRLEAVYWVATHELRWLHKPDGSIELQQLWERVTGEPDWRTVPTCRAGG